MIRGKERMMEVNVGREPPFQADHSLHISHTGPSLTCSQAELHPGLANSADTFSSDLSSLSQSLIITISPAKTRPPMLPAYLRVSS